MAKARFYFVKNDDWLDDGCIFNTLDEAIEYCRENEHYDAVIYAGSRIGVMVTTHEFQHDDT